MAEEVGVRVAPTRRDLARTAGAAALAAGLGCGSGSRQANPSANAVPFALIGAGDRGQQLIQRFNNLGSGRCVAVCDVYEPNLRKAVGMAAARPQPVPDYRAVLERKDVAAVLVATPLYTHFPITRDALTAGKHVLCEPPLVFKTEEIEALRKLAGERSSLILQTAFERRYSLFYQTARQMAAKGMLGEVTEIQAQWNRNPGWVMDPDAPRQRNWRLLREFSGGLTAELGSHQIDLANWVWSDNPAFVSGVGGLDWRRDGRDVFDNVSLVFKYGGGPRLLCSYSSTSRHLPFFGGVRSGPAEIILGTEGTIEITLGSGEQPSLGLWYYQRDVKVTRTEDQEEMAKMVGATAARSGRSDRGFPVLFARDQISGEEPFLEREAKLARRWLYAKGIATPGEERPAVDVMLDSFFECCRTGKSPRAGLDPGLDASRAVILANQAMDEARRIPFA